ncbi:MAG: molybdenum cofactor biosynthesis protein MoaE [Phycisphaerales bacterium]|nr:molybdenum cofactor biosynthesis protein MoaE [Phycisphaerales bacterium]
MADDAHIIDVQLVDGPLPPDRTPPAEGGGACSFIGRTRPEQHPRHGRLRALDYEGYRPLALRTMRNLADTAAQRWSCHRVDLHHSMGIVAVGETSVHVHVACDHRDNAFAACRWLIDTLKQQVPIWKREQWTDGTTWVDGVPVTEHAS